MQKNLEPECCGSSTSSSASSSQNVTRKGSWKRFKESVKQTMQGWVSGGSSSGSSSNRADIDESVPSAVFPSKEVNKATIDVSEVLHNTNCYSGDSTRRRSTKITGADSIPTIVVTNEDKSPRLSPRRTSEITIRNSVSSPDIRDDEEDQAVSFSLPVSEAQGARVKEQTDFEKRIVEKEIQKQMAVMKIRQAINNLDQPNRTERRFSDVPSPSPGGVRRVRSQNARDFAGRQSSPTIRRSGGTGSGSGGLSPQSSMKRRKSTSEMVSRSNSVKKPKPKPMIWEHFDKVSNVQGKCKICQMTLSCKYNTGNFVRHLQLAHKEVYRRYQNKIETQWTQSMLERSLCR